MKRRHTDILSPEDLLESMRQLDEVYEMFHSNNYFVSIKNRQLSVSYSVSDYQTIDDLMSIEEYDQKVSSLEKMCMDVCRWTVDNGKCESATVKIALPRHRLKSIYYPVL
jgi:hypothetical protein